MKNALEQIKKSAILEIEQLSDIKVLEQVRIKYLGKKGELTAILKQMGSLSADERPVIGQLANEIRELIGGEIDEKEEMLRSEATLRALENEKLDVTMPGKKIELGKKHPLSAVLDEIKEIFLGMGFSIAEGPEVELDYYNFEALNIPKNHPARDTQDTFYISDNIVLRTQTSPVQIRVMEEKKPPIRIISAGRVYRSDAG